MACFISYMLRVNISINILAMVEPTNLHENKTLAAAPDVSKPNVQTQKKSYHAILDAISNIHFFSDHPSLS